MLKPSTLKPQRIYSFDIIRIIATLMVIMIHTAGVFVSDADADFFSFTVGNFLDSLSQIAVPLFLMLSGALMLDEEKEFTIRKSIKYALNIFALLGIWSLIYAVIYNILIPVTQGNPVNSDFSNFVSDLLLGHYHMWYLYLIIGLYLITPLLRLFVKKSNLKTLKYFLLLAIFVPFLSVLLNVICVNVFHTQLFASFVNSFKMGYISDYLVYYILGWFLVNCEFTQKQRMGIYLSGITGFLLTFGLNEIFIHSNPNVYESLYSASSFAIFCAAAATFTFFFYRFKTRTFGRASGFIAYISKITFGVYLIHEVFRTVFEAILMPRIPNTLAYIIICFTLTTVISFGVAFIMSKIPLIKKIIKC